MGYPITGPFERDYSDRAPKFTNIPGYQNDVGYVWRRWYRQKKPFDKPLPFNFISRRVVSAVTNEPGYWYRPYYNGTLSDASMDKRAYNNAYARFKDAVGTTASLSVTWAERRQACEMITHRATQLLAFGLALKKGNIPKAAEILGVRTPKALRGQRGRRFRRRASTRENAKAFSRNYLEFHFGWAPLVNDIGNAVNVLQNGIPPPLVKAKGTRTWKVSDRFDGSYWFRKVDQVFIQTVSLRARVRVSNPNLHLANQLGFTNPATVAWELVPFSFVVDWFVPVGDFLASATDFLGLELTDEATTVFTRHSQKELYRADYPGDPVTPVVVSTTAYETVVCKRTPGPISAPFLVGRDLKPWGLRRAAAAISLLIQKGF